jgi:glycosyltransferase involved in cell wall biosynthesis
LREVWLGPQTLTRRFLAGFDALIANSQAEAAELGRLLDVLPPTFLAPSGVDAFFWSSDSRLWAEERQPILQAARPVQAAEELGSAEQYTNVAPKVGVLCVARFDPQKAQHRLIEALRPMKVQLTLAGPDNPNYPAYRRYCQQLAGPGVTILSRRSSMELRKLYASCQVFALCSWYEISALSGLEAACSGARVVMTNRGGWREYGADLAWYADPADLGSIRRAVEAALQAPATPPLRERVLASFTWEHSARALVQAYARALAAPRQAA